ncbi:MAG TPA: hypothetical protein VM347_05270 [Nonomuraea sp.]|nr:hypothetical protein [Nonomuraea sp.]
MSRRSPLAIALALALLVLAVIVPPVAARSGPQSEHARIVAFWTPARMASAVPLDLKPVGMMPAAAGGVKGKPGGGGGGGGGGDTTAVTGASWTRGGPVVDLTGKVYFKIGSSAYICSGSVLTDANRDSYSLVLTAGHCAFDLSSSRFVTEWMFIPNFDAQPSYTCSNTRYGCWTASALVIHYGFANAGSFNNQAVTHDWAFAVVGPGGKSDTQLDSLGSYPIQFSNVSSGDRLQPFGYPAASPYNGSDLVWCAGNITVDVSSSNGSSANATWGVGCNQTGGASGGPWFAGLNETNGSGGTVSSLNSYKYTIDKSRMYGPKFNGNTQATYSTALTTTSGNVVVGSAP